MRITDISFNITRNGTTFYGVLVKSNNDRLIVHNSGVTLKDVYSITKLNNYLMIIK